MRTRKLAVAGVVSFVLTVGFGVAASPTALADNPASASSSEPTPAVATAAEAAQARYVDKAGNPIPVDTDTPDAGSSTHAIGCTPVSGVDNPHISSTSSTDAVQAHGWWKKGTCTAATAHVQVCLYEYFTNGSEGYWERMNCSPRNPLKPGGGSSYRVTAHEDCNDDTRVSWRAHVDVDVDGQIDTSEVPYRQADVYCRVL